MHRYFKDTAGNVYAYNEHQTPRPGLVKMTPPEVEAHLNPPPVPPTADDVRAERDAKLSACDWIVIRAQETGQPVPQEWADYRQALRDVPEQPGFPEDIEWPAEPESV